MICVIHLFLSASLVHANFMESKHNYAVIYNIKSALIVVICSIKRGERGEEYDMSELYCVLEKMF